MIANEHKEIKDSRKLFSNIKRRGESARCSSFSEEEAQEKDDTPWVNKWKTWGGWDEAWGGEKSEVKYTRRAERAARRKKCQVGDEVERWKAGKEMWRRENQQQHLSLSVHKVELCSEALSDIRHINCFRFLEHSFDVSEATELRGNSNP